MKKDLKIGLAFGLVLVACAVLWLATRPSLAPIARMSQIPDAAPPKGSFEPANETDTAEIKPQVTSPEPESPNTAKFEQIVKIKTQRYHIVLKGQTLTQISQKYYGSAGNWKKIFDANRDKIKDPNKVIPGTKIIIPD